MNNKLQQKLFDRFPLMFKDKDLPLTETCMCWGIETGDGWYDLIFDTCLKLDKIVNKDFRFVQIKEKYGGLRMYFYGFYSDEVSKIISEAEDKSENICEVCGNVGKNREKNGWWKTRCNNCNFD